MEARWIGMLAVLISWMVGPSGSYGQVFLKCGELCKQSCNVFGLCGEVYCGGDENVPGMCDCEIEERCVWNGCFNICRPFGGPCETGCDQSGDFPVVIQLPPMDRETAELVEQHAVGLSSVLSMVDGLELGRHRITFARQLEGVELEPGVPAYGRASLMVITVRLGKPEEAAHFEIESKDGAVLLHGRVTADGRAEVDLFHALTGLDEPQTVGW